METPDIKISWNAEDLLSGLNKLDRSLTSKEYAGLEMLMQTVSSKMEVWAKKKAPWADRTGAARQRLHGEAYWENKNIIVAAIIHQVDYGIWLELAHERKYAILEKAIEKHKNQLEESVAKLLERYCN